MIAVVETDLNRDEALRPSADMIKNRPLAGWASATLAGRFIDDKSNWSEISHGGKNLLF